jgi:hypothetical protein
MTPKQLEILQHTLGVDEHGRTPKGFTPYTRNYFCAGGSDEPTCRELVDLGFMDEHKWTEAYPYFNCSVTEAGKKAMHEASPPAPKLTRSQQRYRAYLDADCDMTFFEYMKAVK